MEAMAISDAQLLTWFPKVVIFGLQQAESQERVAALLPDEFDSDKAVTVDQLCDGKLLCCFAIGAVPSLAKGPTGFAVANRLTFFQGFCRNLGIPDAKLFSPPDLWPKPAKNPRALFGCLGALAAALAERPDSKVPRLDAVELSDKVKEAAIAEAAAGPRDEAAERFAAQIAAMAPRKESDSEFERCRKLRQQGGDGNNVVTMVNSMGGSSRDVPLAKSKDNDTVAEEIDAQTTGDDKATEDDKVAMPEASTAPTPAASTAPTQEASPVSAESGFTSGADKEVMSFVYTPAEDSPKFQTDTLPVLQGFLSKRSTGQKRYAFVNTFRKDAGYVKRYFILRDMHLLWWSTQEDAGSEDAVRADGGTSCKGVLNLVEAPLQLEVVKDNEAEFLLIPAEGNSNRRSYQYTVKDAEHSRAEWMENLQAHLEHAARVRVERQAQGAQEGRTRITTDDIPEAKGGYGSTSDTSVTAA